MEHSYAFDNSLTFDDDRGEGPSTATPTPSPRFSKLLGSVLGSPFLTTSDLPPYDDIASMQVDDDAELEMIDGALVTVPRTLTITRPASPSPSFRTETYSIVNWNENNYDIFGEPRPSLSDAAPGCSVRFRPLSARGIHSAYLPYAAPTPYNTARFPSPSPVKSIRSPGLLPKIWDALRESSPTKRGKRRFENITSSLWNELEIDGIVDYASLPPLDGEEGELIEDEACFIDQEVIAVTGVGEYCAVINHMWGMKSDIRLHEFIDIIALLPDEVSLQVLSFLDLPAVLACLAVSKTWRRLAHDNSLWRSLFQDRASDGWTVDLRRYHIETPASLLALSHSGLLSRSPPAQLELDWRDLYKSRTELDRRWAGKSIVGNVEDKENVAVFEPTMRKISGHTGRSVAIELWVFICSPESSLIFLLSVYIVLSLILRRSSLALGTRRLKFGVSRQASA